ncbi:MAG: hypothetical protein PVH21_07855 [Myxococcales bacterium]
MVIEHVVRVLLGLVILVAGRNIFWLFVGAIGFLVGFEVASLWLSNQGAWLVVAAGIVAGVVGAILAVVFQRVGFALAGFYAAIYLAVAFSGKLGLDSASPTILLVAGVAGAILALLLTDWAIILLSALAGAVAISSVFVMAPLAEYAIVAALASMGIIAQRRMLTRGRNAQPR